MTKCTPPQQEKKTISRTLVTIIAACFVTATGSVYAVVDPSKVPEAKRTSLGLYLEPGESRELLKSAAGKTLFVDVRTRAEAMYVGMASDVDALVPFVEHEEIMSGWDEKGGRYKLEPFQDFVPEMNRRLAQKGLTKEDTVILICRSGDRSSRAATRLAQDGYKRVYSIVEGFEGDMSPDGRRTVNGWKNAGLPWSYKLERSKMYFSK